MSRTLHLSGTRLATSGTDMEEVDMEEVDMEGVDAREGDAADPPDQQMDRRLTTISR